SAIDNLSTVVYDFEGKKLVSKTYHNAGTGRVTTVINKMLYDHMGRLTTVYQNNNGAASDQLLVKYEYNELGQLVDKKLHETSAGSNTFLQSVDFRYSIQGWLTSINDAQVTSDNGVTNDETTDYFGMELLYEKAQSGIITTPLYNGNISAVKWKAPGTAAGPVDQRSYKFTYDNANRFKTAVSQISISATDWTKEVNALNESVTGYDLNGNILTLQRNTRKNQTLSTYVSQAADNLTYTYDPAAGDQLLQVVDATSNAAGFDNGTSGTSNDYSYDANGNLLSDKNKGISNTVYNHLGKPTSVVYTDGRHVDYTYDAAGTKLTMKVYAAGGTLQTTTDYANAFVYVNNQLSFFGSPEGRVVNNNGNLEYQYVIADHQGNTRVVFTSVNPTTAPTTATFEDAVADSKVFQNVNTSTTYWVPKSGANNTAGGQYVMRMNSTYPAGPAKSLKVFPGDVVNMEVWTYFEGSSGFGSSDQPLTALITAVASAFGGVNGAPGESGVIYSGISAAYTTSGAPANQSDAVPTAHLNYILFDKDYNVQNMGWQSVPATANLSKQKLTFSSPVTIKEAGYIYVYLSYEGDGTNWVYFDDLKITHTKSNVVQYNEYYPFGLQTASSWTRENSSNNFLYNEGSELNQTTGWYETGFRGFDPALGRFMQIDPMATKFASFSGYHYAANNPIMLNDPTGRDFTITVNTKNGPQYFNVKYHEYSVDNSNWTSGRSVETWDMPYHTPTEDYFTMNMFDFQAKYGVHPSQVVIQNGVAMERWIYEGGTIRDGVKIPEWQYEFLLPVKAQQELMDVTDKFNEQLRQTEEFFSAMGRIFDAIDYPSIIYFAEIHRRAAKLRFFKSQVGTKKPYDIKQPGKGFSPREIGLQAIYNGITYNYDDFGNINYGVAARALGLTCSEAVAGAGYNQTFQTRTPEWSNPGGFFDHSRDTQMIKFGFNMLVPKK
ncbi:MAG TPA: RHS repeat-associated core domain-containing protein, partial [Ohtaekwangia sp.]|uniref:RHS repeat-associated core domain-containing protein n=1 Tax=Ohtaekwangia sp. TaxID=2066019 RepID=UPI002F93B305